MKPEDPTSWIRSRSKSRQDARKASNALREGNEYVSEEIARLEASNAEEWAEEADQLDMEAALKGE